MGVSIKEIVPIQEIEVSQLAGKTLAVDAFNIIYQFLSSIRQPDGTPLMDDKGNVTSHLSGLFYRNLNLMESGIRLVYVFDGKPPSFKMFTTEKRTERKAQAGELYERALKHGDFREARKFSQQMSVLNEGMLDEGKRLLSCMGIPVVQAPSEGEAQASWMAAQGHAYAVVSQDFDSLLFGAPNLVRNLSVTGRRKLPGRDTYVKVPIEMISLKDSLEALELTREQLIWLGLLVGTDYTKGVKGVGPKTALKIVKQHKTLDKILEHVKEKYDYVFPENVPAIAEFFMNPPVEKNVRVSFTKPDENKIREMLCAEHGFSEERVNSGLDRLRKVVGSKLSQQSIGDFFG